MRMDTMPIYFDSAAGVYRFIDNVEAEDSGVEELPFASYLTLEGSSKDLWTFDESQQSNIMFSTKCDHDELAYIDDDRDDELVYMDDDRDDELAYVDDDRDDDYHADKSSTLSKKSKTRPYKKHRYSSSTFLNDSSLFTPEKQLGQTSDADSNGSSLRLYARKDRTPRTIKKMMERHRESERIRHHSLNESLKDVCLRVPGYDPHAKETKVIQMQRIIGYECFLENTLRDLCDQTGIAAKLMKINTHYITDAIRDTPMEEFYHSGHLKTSDNNGDTTQDTSTIVHKRNDYLPPECMVIETSSADKNILRYRREKISSPTVDSTTDNIIRINPLPTREGKYEPAQAVNGKISTANSSKHSQNFIPIGPPSSQRLLFSSPESGIKVETQSSYDNDDDFRDVESLIDHCLVHEKVPTPSFMREETVTTSTSTDEDDVFDLSSPVRNTENVFLCSPPSRGIWHSAKRLHLPDKVDTPGGKEMESISPENILETKPKYTMLTPSVHTSNMLRSNIRPMTEILTRTSSTSGTVGTNPYMPSSKLADVLNVGYSGLHKAQSYCGSKTGAIDSTVCPLGNVCNESLGYPLGSVKTEERCCPFENVCTDEHCQANMQQYSEDKTDSVVTEMNTHYTDIYDDLVMLVGSPEVKNKRKRYLPLKLPFLDVTNIDDSDERDINGSQFKVCKIFKQSNDEQYPVTCLRPAFVTSTRSGTDWRTNISVSIMDDSISASQGVPTSHMQKNLGQVWRDMNKDDQLDGQMWREMSIEDQLPQIDTARQCCSFQKDCHTKSVSKCTSTLADSSTTEGRDAHFDNRI